MWDPLFWQNMITGFLPSIVLALAIFFLLSYPRRHCRTVKGLSTNAAHEWGLVLLFSYLAILFTLTFGLDSIWVSLLHGWSLPEINWLSGRIDFEALDTIHSLWDVKMLLGNILLFLPFGLLLPLLFRRSRCGQVLLCGFLLSLGIEAVQLLIGRVFDGKDLLLNVGGTLLGFLLCFALNRQFPSLTRGFRCQSKREKNVAFVDFG